MHETGMIRKLIETARAEADRRGGRLQAIDVRLGALVEARPSTCASTSRSSSGAWGWRESSCGSRTRPTIRAAST